MKPVRLLPFAALLVAASACGHAPILSSTQQTQSTPSVTTTATPTVVVTAAPTPAPAIASADASDVPGLRAEVTQLSRGAGDVVTLKVAIVNDSDREIDYGNLVWGSMTNVVLDDSIGRKEYHVLVANGPIASAVGAVPAHGRVILWAKYPAPPTDVSSISVVLPHFAPIDDVPIR